jgi:rSAM-associated Gly-rich repeat protein
MKIKHHLLQILATFSLTVIASTLSSYSMKALSAETEPLSAQTIEQRLANIRENLIKTGQQRRNQVNLPSSHKNANNSKIAQWGNWDNGWYNSRRFSNY